MDLVLLVVILTVVNAHLNIASASPGEVLGWTGLDYDWVAQSGGSGTGYFSDDQINPGIHTTAAHFGIEPLIQLHQCKLMMFMV